MREDLNYYTTPTARLEKGRLKVKIRDDDGVQLCNK
jgi:hypothetical protein